MGWILSAVLLILLIIIYRKYNEKQFLDEREKDRYKRELNELDKEVALLRQKRDGLTNSIEKLNKQSEAAIQKYNVSVMDKTKELNDYFDKQRIQRQELLEADIYQRNVELNNEFETRKSLYEKTLQDIALQCEQQAEQARQAAAEVSKDCETQIQQYQDAIEDQRSKFTSIYEVLAQYEKDKQQRLFYTIQVPDEYKDDIEFLLTTVALKIQHPDIISKLVWAEYVKPYLDDTFKRVGIKAEAGIYKLTNVFTSKAYIGKSTDIKRRIADHFKSAVGIQSIADQVVHHEILKTGFWNWTIEPVTYCEKDKLNELEKYYIEFFRTQEWGYNKTGGG